MLQAAEIIDIEPDAFQVGRSPRDAGVAVLTVAGSDSSGGAGIQADLKTIAAHLLYGESVICALTAQNTRGVTGVVDAGAPFVGQQMDAVFQDIPPAAVKVGMLSNAATVRVVAERLRAWEARNVVVDPVMVATSGAALLADDAVADLVARLLPVADVLTPNLPEAERLVGHAIDGQGCEGLLAAAREIARHTRGAVLVKGGHRAAASTDALVLADGSAYVLRAPLVETTNTHGTGCTLSSAIACELALGRDMLTAVTRAKAYLTRCLAAGLDLGSGAGPLDHLAVLR